MSRWISPALFAALLLGSCAQSPERIAREHAKAESDLATALAGRVAGKPVSCLSNDQTRNAQIIDSRTILYSQTGRTVWRNDIQGSCPSLRQGSILIVEVYGSQLCRNDRFRVTEPGATIPSAYCLFGSFTPYTRARN